LVVFNSHTKSLTGPSRDEMDHAAPSQVVLCQTVRGKCSPKTKRASYNVMAFPIMPSKW